MTIQPNRPKSALMSALIAALVLGAVALSPLACGEDEAPPIIPGATGTGVGTVQDHGTSSTADAGTTAQDAGSGQADVGSVVACLSDCDCAQQERCTGGQCIASATSGLCCSQPGCPEGEACTFPDGTAGVCPAPQGDGCATDCDCPALTACVQGRCEPSAAPAYCCSDAPCPFGESCVNPDGTAGTCP